MSDDTTTVSTASFSLAAEAPTDAVGSVNERATRNLPEDSAFSEHRDAEGFRPYPPMRRPEGGFRPGRNGDRFDRGERQERSERSDRFERHDHRQDRAYGRPNRQDEPTIRREHAVALVDARFIAWLGDHADQEPPRRQLVNRWLDRALGDAGIGSPLLRSYWYSHQADERVSVPGQIERRIEQESRDGGASLVLALSRDLMALAQGGACDTALIVSDDDRLLPVVDLAQSLGLRVVVLADESAHDLQTLSRTEPGWTALLRQADARLVVETDQVEDLFWGEREEGEELPEAAVYVSERSSRTPREARPTQGYGDRDEGRGRRFDADRNFDQPPRGNWDRDDRPPMRQRPAPPSAEEIQALNERLTPQIQAWWRDLPELERRNIETDMPAERGLPQEADRGLLLHISRELGRPLNPLEKKAMRDVARGVVLREAEGAAGDSAS
jgi:hypothetical protein